MQYSEIQNPSLWFEPIFSEEFEISHKDYIDLQKHIFSKIPVLSQEHVKPNVSQECRSTFVPQVSTTYVFRITDFKKNERKTVIDILHYKLPFASKKILGNEQHVYEITIEVQQKAKQLYHLFITVQTEAQVKNQKKIKKQEAERSAICLQEKRTEDAKFLSLVARAKAQNTRYVLRKLESQPATVGDLRDWQSISRAAG